MDPATREVLPMIVRILTARVPPDNAPRFNEVLRDKLTKLQSQPGLVYAKLARRFADDGDEEVVLFEEWRSPSDLWAWTQGRLASARLLPGTEEMVEGLVITHYEALDVIPDDLDLSVTWTQSTDLDDRSSGGGAAGGR